MQGDFSSFNVNVTIFIMEKNVRFGVKWKLIESPALPFTDYVTSGK